MKRSTRPVAAGAQLSSMVLFLCLLASGCGQPLEPGVTVLHQDAEHLVLFYLCGDNGLAAEAAGIVDRLESVTTAGSGVAILALLDRPNGAALYQVLDDPENAPGITSPRIPVVALGLRGNSDAVLPAGDPRTLEGVLRHSRSLFPRAAITLVVSGPGQGYHGCCLDERPEPDLLTTPELAGALASAPAAVLVLDASFAAALEIGYELAVRAPGVEYLTAVQGEVPAAGLPYAEAVSAWIEAGPSAPSAGVGLAEELRGSSSVDLSILDLSRTGEIAGSLYALAEGLSAGIESATDRDAIREMLFYDPLDFYATPGDLSLDLADLARVVSAAFPMLAPESAALRDALSVALLPSELGSAGLSVNYIPLLADGRAAPAHHEDYIGSAAGAVALARDGSWAPDLVRKSGLLYRLFYESLP